MDLSDTAWVELPDLEKPRQPSPGVTVGGAADGAPGRGPAANRRSPVREIASWRVLKMWEDGASLGEAVTVKLIGVHEGRSILVTAPHGAGKKLVPAEGGLYRFRSFSGESIYEFSALLMKRCEEPYPYLHLAWPLERHVHDRDLRAAVRVKTDLPCTVRPSRPDHGGVNGVVADLSTGGAAIRLDDDLPAGDEQVHVAFRLFVAGHEVAFDTAAHAVRKRTDGTRRVIGVSFSDLTLTERLALHAFVNERITRQLEVPLYAG